jgi:hypothetical protein
MTRIFMKNEGNYLPDKRLADRRGGGAEAARLACANGTKTIDYFVDVAPGCA